MSLRTFKKKEPIHTHQNHEFPDKHKVGSKTYISDMDKGVNDPMPTAWSRLQTMLLNLMPNGRVVHIKVTQTIFPSICHYVCYVFYTFPVVFSLPKVFSTCYHGHTKRKTSTYSCCNHSLS